MEKIIGHAKIKKRLSRMLERKSIPSAMLFSGPEGVGKFTLAWEFAKEILQEKDDDKLAFKVEILKPTLEEKEGKQKEKSIGVEEIRELQRRLNLTAGNEAGKVALIDKAEKMTIGAQNAFLKTLEEAQAGTVVILVSHDEQKILPTIISRCQRFHFNTVSEKEIEKELSLGEDRKKAVLFWSIGRPGLALDLLEKNEEMDFRKEAFGDLKALFQKSMEPKFTLAEKLSKNVLLAERKMDLWTIVLRRAILGFDQKSSVPKNKAFFLLEKLQEAREKIKDTNVNAKLILENLFLNF